jgi:4-amino-4-deoxy-L-arabinose transferase-like glycosyltransferase
LSNGPSKAKNPLYEWVLIGITLISIISVFIFSQFNVAMSWDEATYTSLARHLYREQGYYNPYFIVDSLRPPLFPSLIALIYILFGESENLARIVSPLSGALLIPILYTLSRRMGMDEFQSLLVMSLLATNPIFLFLSTRVLADILFTTLLTLTTLCLYLSVKSDKGFLLASSFLAGACFLCRYTGIILPPLIVLFLLKLNRKDLLKSKYLWSSALIFILTITPWFGIGLQYFKHPLGGLGYAHAVGVGSPYWFQNLYKVTQYFLVLLFLSGAVAPLTIYGIYRALKRRDDQETWLLILWISLIFLFFCALRPEASIRDKVRFLLPVLPALSILTVRTYAHLTVVKRKLTLMLPALCLLSLFLNLAGGYWLILNYSSYEKHVDLMEACLYVKSLMPENASVMSNFWPFVIYYVDSKCVRFPEETDFIHALKDYNVAYVMVSKYFPPPNYVHLYLGDASLFEEEFKIERDGRVIVMVYRCLEG